MDANVVDYRELSEAVFGEAPEKEEPVGTITNEEAMEILERIDA